MRNTTYRTPIAPQIETSREIRPRLKVKVIKTPQEKRTCATCGKLIDREQLRFFVEGGPIFHIHPWCSRETRRRLEGVT